MERERIKVKDLAVNAEYPNDKNLHISDWDTCTLIEQEQISFDGEKGFVDYRVIVQRFSDNKFFEITYTDFGLRRNDLLEQIAKEVFEKTKTINYYE